MSLPKGWVWPSARASLVCTYRAVELFAHLCTIVRTNRFTTSDREGNVGPTSLAQIRSVLADLLDIP
jgi:hypothetical protein